MPPCHGRCSQQALGGAYLHALSTKHRGACYGIPNCYYPNLLCRLRSITRIGLAIYSSTHNYPCNNALACDVLGSCAGIIWLCRLHVSAKNLEYNLGSRGRHCSTCGIGKSWEQGCHLGRFSVVICLANHCKHVENSQHILIAQSALPC